MWPEQKADGPPPARSCTGAQGPQEKLDSTLYSQPAIFVCSLAAMEIAKGDAPEMLKKVKTAAGFSLGEYSALVFGGALSFEAGLKVVKARAEAMDAAAKSAKSGMASIGGVADDKLQACLDEAATAVGSGKAYIANYSKLRAHPTPKPTPKPHPTPTRPPSMARLPHKGTSGPTVCFPAHRAPRALSCCNRLGVVRRVPTLAVAPLNRA